MFVFAYLVAPHCNSPNIPIPRVPFNTWIRHVHPWPWQVWQVTVEALTGLARSSSGKSFAALTLGISKTLGTSFSSLEALFPADPLDIFSYSTRWLKWEFQRSEASDKQPGEPGRWQSWWLDFEKLPAGYQQKKRSQSTLIWILERWPREIETPAFACKIVEKARGHRIKRITC